MPNWRDDRRSGSKSNPSVPSNWLFLSALHLKLHTFPKTTAMPEAGGKKWRLFGTLCLHAPLLGAGRPKRIRKEE